jgi:hypothetical protein
MATKPTVTIEDIQDTVRSEAVQRREQGQAAANTAGHSEEAGTGTQSSTQHAPESAHESTQEPAKTVILYSWLGGKIVVKRVGTQLYLSLFR